jgi:hypothetical protein
MAELAEKLWVLGVLLGCVGALGVLHCLASGLRNSVKEHDLRVRVNELRNMQLQRLRDRGTTFGLPGSKGHSGKKAA